MPKTKTTDTILLNPSFNALTPFQENLYWRLRLLSQRYPSIKETSAEPSDLKSTLYPLKRDLRESQVQSALTALTLAGMIAVYPDDTGHPYLRLISADSLTSHGGDIGGDDHRHPMMTVSQPSNPNGEITENVPNSLLPSNEYQGDAEKGNAEILGVTERDVTETMERRNTIEYEARQSGLPINPRAMQMAENWAAEYSVEWLVKAIQQAALTAPNWKYVHGILRGWKERGSCEDIPPEQRRQRKTDSAKPSLRRSKKTDAELDEELKKWGVNLGG